MNPKYTKLLEEWTEGLTGKQALIKVFEKSRDIPFQFIGSRDIDSMLKAGVGTCNAKHMLLKELADGLGFETRFIVDKFNLSDFLRDLDHSNELVKEMEDIASKLEPYHHTYLQIKIDGNWVSVDINFDTPLAKHGFAVPLDWDGSKDTKLPHNPIKTYIEKDEPGKLKEKLLAGESVENKQLRKEFFAKLNEYIASLRE